MVEHGSPERPATLEAASAVVPCAGAVLIDDAGRLLLIRRGHAPGAGLWSVPGGRCRPGEDAADACVREVREETGLHVSVQRRAGRVELPAPGGATYVVDDFLCRVTGGTVRAGDDAAEVRWVARADLTTLPLTPGLLETLAGWQLLPD